MKKVFVVIVLVLGVIIFGVFLWPEKTPRDTTDDTFTDLNIQPGVGRPVVQDSTDRVVVQTGEGSVIEINNVRTLPATREVSSGRYELRQSVDDEYFLPFNIVYAEGGGSFAISINAEPVVETRRSMEEFLRSMLGISEVEMCKLNVYVGVPTDVNSFLSGQNIGFSFCPGSVSLE
ncbi:MAG: hypothetical protein ACI9VM_000789 [Candidatus Azotimanducaceae bacterium]|jgi:hypothetical protein